MNLKIQKMVLDNFKGIRHKELQFADTNEITGENGAGKTTIATAYHWVFANTDYDLKSNPNIYPINLEEGTPLVEIEMTIEGKPVRIRKTQSRKVTESGGTRKVALTNTYSVNEVPMSERDMQSKLTDMGFDFEKFSTLTNPNAFLAEKKDVQRKILFSMATTHTDYEIASTMDGVYEAAELLKNYTVDEIKAMSNATLKKINENYGKKGEILNSKIEGLESAKVDLDFSALELLRNMLKEQIDQNRNEQEKAHEIEKRIEEIRKQNMELQFNISGLDSKLQAERKAAEDRQLSAKREAQEKAIILDRDIQRYRNESDIHESGIARVKNEISTLETKVSEVEAEVFDENSLYCSLCGQLLQFEKREDVRRDFEANKLKRIADLHTRINEAMSLSAIKGAELAEIKAKLNKAINDRSELETALNGVVVLNTWTEEALKLNGELNKLKAELGANDYLIEKEKATMPDMGILNRTEVELNGQLRDCEVQLSKADLNAEIDDKIAALREEQLRYEQKRADTEKVLYQVDLIQKRKNELLTEEINKNFSIVKFVFFTYLKNGSYTEACIPTIDGKELGSSTNTGLEIRAKLDIISGLQKYNNLFFPVMLDGGESLDATSKAAIQMPCQMIYLTVTNDKGLNIR
ncbi:MAG: hypothetical protein IKN54_05450 [Lachnospiraceae bacterium]|nr:hypothetical protein [Lachnospiraceae bacterium]